MLSLEIETNETGRWKNRSNDAVTQCGLQTIKRSYHRTNYLKQHRKTNKKNGFCGLIIAASKLDKRSKITLYNSKRNIALAYSN